MRVITLEKKSTFQRLQNATTLLRTVTVLIATTLVFSVFTTPAFAEGVEKIEKQTALYKAQSSERLSKNLSKVEHILNALEQNRYSKATKTKALAELSKLKQTIEADAPIVLEQFEVDKKYLMEKKLPQSIIERHDNMVEHFKAYEHEKLQQISVALQQYSNNFVNRIVGHIYSILKSKEEVVVSPITDVDPSQFTRHNQPKNPDFLPTNVLQPNLENKPKMSKADFTLSGLTSNPKQYYAALGEFRYSDLVGADNPEYLNEDDAVVFTDAIKEKAAELNHDAVAIYHWVRNNVEWIPSWGAAQNAQLTLETMRGNAFDIATLTIALLRASGIPARYVHGNIKVPAEQFKNWAGGFSDIVAAGNYASSAGVPIGFLEEAGAISHMMLEHIWVEAATDYYPSRGARNINADSWIALDPSFKQYEYHEGIDAMEVSGIDADALVQQILDSANINDAEGSISSLDTTILEKALTDAQSKLEKYIDTNMTNPNVLDVIGGKKSIVQEYPTLPSSLPNEFLVGTHYASIPTQLKRTVTITLQGTDAFDYMALLTGTRGGISETFNFTEVNNEKVTLSFRPATQADEETLASYLPQGEITDLSQLPASLPAYLINVIPELKVNGEVVLSGKSMRLGEELDVTMQAHIPSYGTLCYQTHRTVAGSYLSLNVISQSVSTQKLAQLQKRLEQTQTFLESNDSNQQSSLTREEILGDMMYAGTLSYFAQLQAQSEIAGLSAKAVTRLVASNGVFGYEPQVNYLFGVARSISQGGIVLDIPMNSVTQSLDGNQDNSARFLMQIGTTASALEHQVPEQMFNTDPANPVEAISAVKALQLANQEGQKIYQINQSNISQILPNLHLSSDIISEIQTEVAKGKEVTTHTSNVSVPGWTGAGYIVIDPKTGDGGYYISGGSNGGFAQIKEGLDQIVFALYALSELVWSNLSVSAALIWHTILGNILALVDNIRGLLAIFKTGGLAQMIAAYAILSMLTQITVLLTIAAVGIASSTTSMWLMIGLITYTMGSIFNLLVPKK